MSIGLIIFFTALITTIGAYIDKHIVTKGISRHDYFYYMCVSMIPFAVIMCFVEPMKFEFNFVPLLLLGVAMVLRYIKQHTIVGCLRHLDPHEFSTYMSLTVVVAFFIDTITGIKEFSFIHLLAVILAVTGVFIFMDVKLKMKSLQKDLIIKILADVAMGYVTYFILKYWSNAVYILLLNLTLTFIFTPGYTIKHHNDNKEIIKLVFLQQGFGFFEVYLANYLASKAVTYEQFVKPTSLILMTIGAIALKNIKRKPKVKEIFAIIMVASGILLINI